MSALAARGIFQLVATAELKSSLTQFVTFARSLKGDEKSEAQSFLDQLFRALGHPSAIEAGATFEFRVAKKPGSAQLELIKGDSGRDGSPSRLSSIPKGRFGETSLPRGGKKFADLLWPERGEGILRTLISVQSSWQCTTDRSTYGE